MCSWHPEMRDMCMRVYVCEQRARDEGRLWRRGIGRKLDSILPTALIKEAASLAGLPKFPDAPTGNLGQEYDSMAGSGDPSSVASSSSSQAPPPQQQHKQMQASEHDFLSQDSHRDIETFKQTVDTATRSAEAISNDIDDLQFDIESLAATIGLDATQFNDTEFTSFEDQDMFSGGNNGMIASATRNEKIQLYQLAGGSHILNKYDTSQSSKGKAVVTPISVAAGTAAALNLSASPFIGGSQPVATPGTAASVPTPQAASPPPLPTAAAQSPMSDVSGTAGAPGGQQGLGGAMPSPHHPHHQSSQERPQVPPQLLNLGNPAANATARATAAPTAAPATPNSSSSSSGGGGDGLGENFLGAHNTSGANVAGIPGMFPPKVMTPQAFQQMYPNVPLPPGASAAGHQFVPVPVPVPVAVPIHVPTSSASSTPQQQTQIHQQFSSPLTASTNPMMNPYLANLYNAHLQHSSPAAMSPSSSSSSSAAALSPQQQQQPIPSFPVSAEAATAPGVLQQDDGRATTSTTNNNNSNVNHPNGS
ncbi:hypothetical protein BDB00DRAFT_435834 [Zychaea mexicana]|uniref:uncharacterized protein n=1 Tax=Zychaea mexicana TaxID=64656 RepID=UPI0022FE5FDF|nr:uncharacterized protein BDB00DRAFT_435834 [Zychaea mexicana]KAI9492344.1 hypothetical protein BDB00DRAFT_435834 [Zychaea mexicana]